jgi:pteridine reductase
MVGRRQLGRGRAALRGGSPGLTRALVTGGTGKLGRGLVERLDAEGWRVLAAGRRDGDLARADAARALVERAVGELGGLDVVVNGASAGFEPKPFEEVTEADVDAALGATVKGSFFVTQAAAAHLRESRGLAVMLEDVAAYLPWPSFAAHCAAKAAQAMLTRTLARALAPEVRVCGVAPGPVAVEPDQEERRRAETVLGRLGDADDVAGAILYLAGADFVTGTTLVVDGGRLLRSPGQSGPSRHA